MTASSQRIVYFGKLPGCGDFVRSSGDQVLVELTDQWLATVMQRLSSNSRWRQHYDACPPLDFAFVGTRSRQVVSGHLRASRDQSARRFPFVCMAVHQLAKPREFLPCSPLALAPAWTALAQTGAAALSAPAGRPAEASFPAAQPDVVAAQAALDGYLATACLADLGEVTEVRRQLLALGLLLSPLSQNASAATRCLALPLPQEAAQRPAMASFWMSLAAPMLAKHDLELAIFCGTIGGKPALVLGLDGANPATLHAVIDPEAAQQGMVTLADCAWVEGSLAFDPALQRLSACLEQGQLGLPVAAQLFHETFC